MSSPLLLVNKPFNMLCQFTDEERRATLADVVDRASYPGFYPAGRLDYDSEGLVALTSDGQLQHRIAHPEHKLAKTYWVQVEGKVDPSKLERLSQGVELKDGLTQPCKAQVLASPTVWPRTPPIRERANIPTHWLEITLVEGRNRQVRRMTAHVGLPTLRLIRFAIGPWDLTDLKPGESRLIAVNLPKSHSPQKTRHEKRARPGGRR